MVISDPMVLKPVHDMYKGDIAVFFLLSCFFISIFLPCEHITTKHAPNDVAQMRHVVHVWQSAGDEDISLTRNWKTGAKRRKQTSVGREGGKGKRERGEGKRVGVHECTCMGHTYIGSLGSRGCLTTPLVCVVHSCLASASCSAVTLSWVRVATGDCMCVCGCMCVCVHS